MLGCGLAANADLRTFRRIEILRPRRSCRRLRDVVIAFDITGILWVNVSRLYILAYRDLAFMPCKMDYSAALDRGAFQRNFTHYAALPNFYFAWRHRAGLRLTADDDFIRRYGRPERHINAARARAAYISLRPGAIDCAVYSAYALRRTIRHRRRLPSAHGGMIRQRAWFRAWRRLSMMHRSRARRASECILPRRVKYARSL